MAAQCTEAESADGIANETAFAVAEEGDSAVVQCKDAACVKTIRERGSAAFLVVEMPRHKAFILLRKDLGEKPLADYVVWAPRLDRL